MRTTRSRALATGVAVEPTFSTPPDIVNRRRRSRKLAKRAEREISPVEAPLTPTPTPAQEPAPAAISPPVKAPSPSPAPTSSPQTQELVQQNPATPAGPSHINLSVWSLSELTDMASGFFANISSFSPFKRNVRNVPQAPPSSPSPVVIGDSPSITSSSPIIEENAPQHAIVTDNEETPRPSPSPSISRHEETPSMPRPSFLQPLPPTLTQSVSTPKSKLPYQRPMLTGKKRQLRAKYRQDLEEKALRKQGLKPQETEAQREQRKETAYQVWLLDAHQKKNLKQDYEEFVPDESSELGSKRKNNVGKTFSVPEPESAESESEFDQTSPTKPPTQPRQFLIPKSPSKKAGSPIPPMPISHTNPTPFDAPAPLAPAVMSSPPRVGRTFAMPENSLASSEDNSHPSIRDSDLMSFTMDQPEKDVHEWTQDDYKEYLKAQYGFDPQELLKEVDVLRNGDIPPSLMTTFNAAQEFKNKFLMEHEREMTLLRVELENMRHIVATQRLTLAEEEDVLVKQRALTRAQYNGETLSEQVNYSGPRENNELGFPYCSPDTSTTLDNVFATAAANKNENITAARPTEVDQTTPTPSSFRPSQQIPETPSKLPSVTWADNTIHNHAAPGPNEPVKSTTPAPKSALKGHQLQSLERKMSEATRYTPKQPSRLREVSEVAKPVVNSAIPLSFLNKMTFKISDNPFPHIRDNLHTYYDEMPSGFDNLWAGSSMEDSIVFNPYPESRNMAVDMIMQLESQH